MDSCEQCITLYVYVQTLKDWHLIIVALSLTFISIIMLVIGDSVPVLRASPKLASDNETPDVNNVSNACFLTSMGVRVSM